MQTPRRSLARAALAGALMLGGSSLVRAAPPLPVNAPGKPVAPVAPPPGATVPQAASPKPARPDTLDPLLSVRPEGGLIEGMTFSEDGGALWLVRTDNTSRTSLDVVELTAGATPKPRFEIEADAATLEAFVALPGGALGFVRAGDGQDVRALTVLGADGKKRWEARNLWQAGWPQGGATGAAARAVVLVEKPATGGWMVSAREAPSGRLVAKARALSLDAQGLVRGLGLKPVGFLPGFTGFLGERPGAYDKAKDTRLPSVAVTVDTLTGRMVREATIDDRYAWALTAQLRAQSSSPDRTIFLRLTDDADTSKVSLELVDAQGLLHPLALPTNPRLYDRKSLVVDGPDGEGRMTFSLAVDPVNPDAVARKKADLPALDLFELDVRQLPPGRSPHPGSPEVLPLKAVQRTRLALGDRPVSWLRRGDTVALLRRFKAFARGGDQVDIFRLPPLP